VVYGGYGLLFVPLIIVALPLYLVPRPWLYGLARVVGLWALYPFVRERIDRNLYYAYESRMNAGRARALGRKVAVNVAYSILDCYYLWVYWWRYPFRKYIDPVVNIAPVDSAREAGRGLIVVAAHYNCFEVMPAWFTRVYGWTEGGVIPRSFPSPVLNALNARARMLHKVPSFYDDAKGVIRALRGNAVIGILPDLHAKKRLGRRTTFYGKPTLTFDIHVRVAAHMRTPIVPAYLMRHPRHPWEYTLLFYDAIHVPRKPDEATIGAITQRINDVFEHHIRRWPCGWIWFHNKWHLW
jgi:lauroyl/myristoyl acyltransferase